MMQPVVAIGVLRDALIAAITIGREAVLLTTEVDFRRMAEVGPLRLLAVPASPIAARGCCFLAARLRQPFVADVARSTGETPLPH